MHADNGVADWAWFNTIEYFVNVSAPERERIRKCSLLSTRGTSDDYKGNGSDQKCFTQFTYNT